MDPFKLRQEAAKHVRLADAYGACGDWTNRAHARNAAIGLVDAAAAIEALHASRKGVDHG